MVLRMTRPTKRPESSFLTFRKRVPADILAKANGQSVTIQFPAEGTHEAATVIAKIGSEIKFSLRTREPSIAKSRTGVAEAHLQRTWEALRSGPRRLTHKQVVALAGKLYEVFAVTLEDDPGDATTWQKVIENNDAANSGALGNPLKIPNGDRPRHQDSLEHRFGPLVDTLLQREGLVIDEGSRHVLLRESGIALTDAAKKLKRNAEGDYRPDKEAERFPAWEAASAPKPALAVTLTSLMTGWKKEATARNLSQSTFDEYESRYSRFKKWIGHDDATKVTAEDIVRYKEHRLSEVSAKTVKDSDLTTLKAIFGWAVANKKLPNNPALGVTVRAPKVVLTREKSFTEDETAAILKAAKAYAGENKRENSKTAAAKRWLPWLCAYSGARIGEVAQLRREDFSQSNGHWFYTITPDAGPVKTKIARRVPVHEHLFAEGLIDYVQGVSRGYLFMTAKTKDEAEKKLGPIKNRVREFVRTVVTDDRVSPNHGWRHTFKTRAMEADISDRLADIITGHAARTEGDKYRGGTDRVLIAGMAKFPRYES